MKQAHLPNQTKIPRQVLLHRLSIKTPITTWYIYTGKPDSLIKKVYAAIL